MADERFTRVAQPTALCVGHCTLDTICVVPRFPPPDSKMELQEFAVQGGGAAATAAVTLSQLGIATSFVGKVGDDERGDTIRRSLAHMDVNVSGMIVQPKSVTQFSDIIIEAVSGRRTTYWTRGSVEPMLETDVSESLLKGVHLLHVDGHHPAAQLRLAQAARKAGIIVTFDAGDFTKGASKLIALTDVMIASERFASEFSGLGEMTDAMAKIREAGPETVVVTMGAEGSLGIDSEGTHYQKPIVLAEERDTIGAGDVYRGAFIFALFDGKPLSDAMAFATAAASLSLRELGGRSSLPSRAEIDDLLKKAAP